MTDSTTSAVADLLIAHGPDQPHQYRAIAEQIVALVRRHDYTPPDMIAPRWAATYLALKDGTYLGQIKSHRGVQDAVMCQLIEELSKAEAYNAEYQLTFDLQWKADMRAIAMWQQAHPGNQRVWPDRANMVVWLMNLVDEWQLVATQLQSAIEQADNKEKP